MCKREQIFDVYADPGHAWAKVSRLMLVELGILSKITRYSYQRGAWVYLEEDCDLSTLVNALKAKGITYRFREHMANKQSRIRGYERFCLDVIDYGCAMVIAKRQMAEAAYLQ